jgi:GNAT superfamily N-acetyltransferase
MDLRFREECYGHSGGQTDCSLYALLGDEVIGKVDIAYHRNGGRREAYIKMIEVQPNFQGKGVGKALIYKLASQIPYEAIDWGMTTPEGGALKQAMDREFGTSYVPPEPEPDMDDPKYADDLSGERYFADLKVWRQKQGYVDEANYHGKGMERMKVKDLKKLVAESVAAAVKEAGYDQYGEGVSQPTEPSWFDTLMAPDEPAPELKGTPEARKLVDAAKLMLKKAGPKIDKEVMSQVSAELEHNFNLPDGVSWEVVHAAFEELKSDMLSEAPPEGWHGTVRAMKTHGHTGKGGEIDNPYALAHYMANKGDEPHYKEQPTSKKGTPVKKKEYMKTEAFVDLVRQMIREEILNLRKGK